MIDGGRHPPIKQWSLAPPSPESWGQYVSVNLYRQPLALSLHAQAHTQQIGRGYVLPDVLCSDFHVIEDQPSFYIFTTVLNVGKTILE